MMVLDTYARQGMTEALEHLQFVTLHINLAETGQPVAGNSLIESGHGYQDHILHILGPVGNQTGGPRAAADIHWDLTGRGAHGRIDRRQPSTGATPRSHLAKTRRLWLKRDYPGAKSKECFRFLTDVTADVKAKIAGREESSVESNVTSELLLSRVIEQLPMNPL